MWEHLLENRHEKIKLLQTMNLTCISSTLEANIKNNLPSIIHTADNNHDHDGSKTTMIPSISTTTPTTTTTESESHYLTKVTPWRLHIKQGKTFKKDLKLLEREEKRKRLEIDQKRRFKMQEYHKTLNQHRDDFLKFHKARKLGVYVYCHVMCILMGVYL